MYYTGMDPFTMKPMFVETDQVCKEVQKQILVEKTTLRLVEKRFSTSGTRKKT